LSHDCSGGAKTTEGYFDKREMTRKKKNINKKLKGISRAGKIYSRIFHAYFFKRGLSTRTYNTVGEDQAADLQVILRYCRNCYV